MQNNVDKVIKKKELQNIFLDPADFVFIQNKYLVKDSTLIFKDDKKSKEVIAAGIVVNIKNSSFCKVLIGASKDANIEPTDLILIDYRCLLKCHESKYDTQCKILKSS